ncbi:larval cuticle protein 16/17-like [Manduca sexta]|uniref:Larval cuticle protein 1-like n=1 Tax=Manduca sexta TaxID=7130 RepID=A0A921Z7U1_MANSE|nr:larval cuticle protein 16/17-like [Manduca sexta]KAG6451802.1 hypothetical protein O3G_MSEX007365 [Manduca sexta]KAG6451803.1 hypothetical protein O3G_MSEX007365 [Manduca sexta]
MKLIILVALAVVTIAVAAPPEPPKILKSEFDQGAEGGYVFNFETENGIARAENGEVKDIVDEENKPHRVVIVRGSYSYIGDDGKPVSIEYFADENGYHAQGDSIPKVQ